MKQFPFTDWNLKIPHSVIYPTEQFIHYLRVNPCCEVYELTEHFLPERLSVHLPNQRSALLEQKSFTTQYLVKAYPSLGVYSDSGLLRCSNNKLWKHCIYVMCLFVFVLCGVCCSFLLVLGPFVNRSSCCWTFVFFYVRPSYVVFSSIFLLCGFVYFMFIIVFYLFLFFCFSYLFYFFLYYCTLRGPCAANLARRTLRGQN